MNWRFFINDIEIEEPAGFADLAIEIKRDDNWKGIFFEATTSGLRFYGKAFDMLQQMKELTGLKSKAIFRAEYQCDQETLFEEAIKGKLNFGQYKETCGGECFVTLPVEQDDCTMILRNRYDQKVDIDDVKAFDKASDLAPYDQLKFSMQLPSVELAVGIDANVAPEGYEINAPIEVGFVSATFAFRPLYTEKRDDSISTGNVDTGIDSASTPPVNALSDVISPQLLLNDQIKCFIGEFDYTFRLKGSFSLTDAGLITVGDTHKIRLMRGTWPNPVTAEIASSPVTFTSHPGGNYTGTFDVTFTGSTVLNDGEGLYMIFQFETQGVSAGPGGMIHVMFDPECMVLITASKTCHATNADVYAINEMLSRIAESITNNCIRMKSDYYGRTDSQPFASLQDGCGSLRVLTNGLKIRQATPNNLFLSLKDAFESLNSIDNIGIGIEDDTSSPNADAKVLRIEPARYFFNDTEILRFDFIPQASIEIVEPKVYSIINIGYEKWETAPAIIQKGLQEFNSNKQFRTSLDSVNNTLDQVSKFIAGSITIEVTRQQQFAESGQADTQYDNDTFIICTVRTGYLYNVEKGNIGSPENIFSPATVYNWRIRPFYNLMRWAKSIFQSYANFHDPDSKLYFMSGTGNYIAKGELLAGDPCKLENGAKAENKDLSIDDFENEIDGAPILKAETISFDYPLSINDYRKIKKNPYGFISVQCGFGDYLKAYIQTISYKIADGIATFNLIVGQGAPPPLVPVINEREFREHEFSDEFS